MLRKQNLRDKVEITVSPFLLAVKSLAFYGDGDGAAAPSSAPATPSVPSASPDAGSGGANASDSSPSAADSEAMANWDMPEDVDNVPVGGEEAASAASPAQVEQPTTAAATKPAVAQTTTPEQGVATPPSTTVQTPPASQPATPQASAQPGDQPSSGAAKPMSYGEAMDAGRAAILADLSANKFKLTAQEAELADAGDNSWIPQMASRVYYEATRSAVAIMEQALPAMIQAHQTAVQAQTQADGEFYGKFADLANHREQVFGFAKVLRTLNPSMPKDQFMQTLATQSRAMLGLGTPQPGQTTPAPVATATQAAPASNGFKPIVSRVPSAGAGPVDPNDWAAINDMFDNAES